MPRMFLVACCSALLVGSAWAQAQPPIDSNPPATDAKSEHRKGPGAAHDIGSGAGNIGTGTAKGAGDAAKGVGKGAVDLVTLHPVNAATSVGKGAASAGKDVTVGAAKGTGKIARGVGKVFKKIF